MGQNLCGSEDLKTQGIISCWLKRFFFLMGIEFCFLIKKKNNACLLKKNWKDQKRSRKKNHPGSHCPQHSEHFACCLLGGLSERPDFGLALPTYNRVYALASYLPPAFVSATELGVIPWNSLWLGRSVQNDGPGPYSPAGCFGTSGLLLVADSDQKRSTPIFLYMVLRFSS